jgi:hypothetical protein
MEKIKKISRALGAKILFIFWQNKKGRYLVWLLSVFILGLFYLGISFLSVSKTAVALIELESSFAPEIICHEKCALFRQAREQLIISDLRRSNTKTAKRLFKSWQNKKLSLGFRREIVKLLFLAYGANNPPPYLKTYLVENEADLEVIQEIIARFPLIVNGYEEFKNKLAERLAQEPSLEERLDFLRILREISNDSEIDSYFTVLLGSDDKDFKRETLKNISDIKDKTRYFKLEHLEIIKALILKDATDNSLRRELALLIGDYYLVFPEESAALWEEIYRQESLDAITRLFSADSLNHLRQSNLILPEVSTEEWNEYYN